MFSFDSWWVILKILETTTSAVSAQWRKSRKTACSDNSGTPYTFGDIPQTGGTSSPLRTGRGLNQDITVPGNSGTGCSVTRAMYYHWTLQTIWDITRDTAPRMASRTFPSPWGLGGLQIGHPNSSAPTSPTVLNISWFPSKRLKRTGSQAWMITRCDTQSKIKINNF